jgi:hypothetical protein
MESLVLAVSVILDVDGKCIVKPYLLLTQSQPSDGAAVADSIHNELGDTICDGIMIDAVGVIVGVVLISGFAVGEFDVRSTIDVFGR